MQKRKYFIDNIRWITMSVVVIYHIIYIFNNSGVIKNMTVNGIPQMDAFLVFVYPWFMCLLFVVAGISSRYSLNKRTHKQFLKERTNKLLLTSLGIFIYGWIAGFITNQYNDIFAESGDKVPGIVKYLIYCLMGIGPLWFCHVLFVGCVLLVIYRKIDKKDRFWNLCRKINLPIIIALVLPVWGSSFILNSSMIGVYRFGIYLFMFFMGYFIFSHDEVLEKLKKISIPLGIIALIFGILYTVYYYGQNYSSDDCLKSIFTNAYLWVMILAILGLGQKFLDFHNKFTKYMTKNNFNFYILHFTVVLVSGHLIVKYLNLPFALNYILIFVITVILLPILTEIIKRIPIINRLVLGIYNKN